MKSNIGHALTAAGAAGLLKVLLALKNRILPPTANFDRASPKLGLDESPFRVLSRERALAGSEGPASPAARPSADSASAVSMRTF